VRVCGGELCFTSTAEPAQDDHVTVPEIADVPRLEAVGKVGNEPDPQWPNRPNPNRSFQGPPNRPRTHQTTRATPNRTDADRSSTVHTGSRVRWETVNEDHQRGRDARSQYQRAE
jgi:hypothetical protein